MTVNGASVHSVIKLYGIPDRTLRDRFRGPFQSAPDAAHCNVNPGPSTTLNLGDERYLLT